MEYANLNQAQQRILMCLQPLNMAVGGDNMKNLILIVSIPAFVLLANVVDAFDFYGASVTFKEVSMNMWRMGISGKYPVIDNVTMDSPAEKAGLSQGNIILSVNKRVIKNVSDLDTFTDDTLSVNILNGYSREKIFIDRIAIEAEKIRRTAEERKSIVEVVTSNTNTSVAENTIDLTPVVLNDAVLEKKLGRSAPVYRTGNNDTYKEISYYDTCKSILSVILKAPGSARFLPFADSDKYYRSGNFVISSYVDSQNGFGAFLRAPWKCTVDIQLNKVKDLTFKDTDIVRDFKALPDNH